MLKAGNRVHFEPDNCHVEHIRTGTITPIAEVNGTFELGVWVPKLPSVRSRSSNEASHLRHVASRSGLQLQNRFAALNEDPDDNKMSGFAWPSSS